MTDEGDCPLDTENNRYYVNDMGLVGHWYFLEKAMKNYDVNEAKLADCLPDTE